MNTKNIAFAVAVLAVVLIGAGMVWSMGRPAQVLENSSEELTGTSTPATTTPTGTESVPPARDTAALGERIYTNEVYITPIEILEDSRCPVDVQCIQAGTVRLKAKLEMAGHTETVEFDLGSPVAFGNKHIALMSVTPIKRQAVSIAPTDYRFTFTVAYGMSEGFGPY